MSYEILGVIGAILGVLLAINGYYFKEMSKNLLEMRIRLEVWISKHDNVEKVAEKNSADIINLKERLHKIEGGTLQVKQFIEDYYNDKNN